MWDWIVNNWEGILATCAIILTLTEIVHTRKHNKLSVKPHLGTFGSNTSDNGIINYTFFLTCDGLGPAEIETFAVYYKNELLAKNDVMVTQKNVGEKISDHFKKAEYYVAAFTEGAVLPAGQKIPLLTMRLAIFTGEEKNHLINFLDNFRLEIKYKSLYGEKFELNSEKLKKTQKLPDNF